MDDRERIDDMAEVFQALSDPNRLRILELLVSSERNPCVNCLAGHLDISQSAVSQHLKVLKNAGLVSDRKMGYFKHYSVNEERFREIRRMRADILGKDLSL